MRSQGGRQEHGYANGRSPGRARGGRHEAEKDKPMTEPMPDLGTVLARLEGVEKQNRNLKQVGAVLAILLGIGFLLGVAAPKSRTIEADRFVLTDGKGASRMVMALSEKSGEPYLSLTDAKGKERFWVGIQRDEAVFAHFLDTKGRKRVAVGVDQTQSPGGGPSDRQGSASLELVGGSGDDHIQIFSDDYGPPLLYISSKNGPKVTNFVRLGVDMGGEAFLNFGRNNLEQIILQLNQGSPEISFTDTEARTRFKAGLGPGGSPDLAAFSKDGKVIWSAP